ncbi:serine hydrolase domain-containing protein [Paenibacillus guangzhouensis]|uniref:serine hydrolase domain-containing protein n=1 Tax=Paenibacillus guangzhouensis TaxID=1473112 RepID=UPI001267714F|nr:serine hydrolase [Paenibacillus guangzhouensis]
MDLSYDYPENHGLSSRSLSDLYAAIEEQGLAVNTFMLLQNGCVTSSFARSPYRLDRPQLLFSLSKSITSIAVGIAWDQGLVRLNDPVISFFPERLLRKVSPHLARMAIHHLLSMNTGHHDNIYAAVTQEQDWVRAFLALDVEHEPGTHYRYSTPATYMLSAILERVTGQTLIDYLMPRLFKPLRIPRPTWETCPMGVTAGGMGLSLSTESVAKIGLMLLNQGRFEGTRILSEKYIQLATTEQSDNRLEAKRIDSAQGYGYQIHLCRRGCYRGDGGFGQLCFVAPREKIVIAATSSFQSMDQLQTLLDLIYTHIMDALDQNKQDRGEAVNTHDLQERLAGITVSYVPSQSVPSFEPPDIHHRTYALKDNPFGLRTVAFMQQDTRLMMNWSYEDGRDHQLPFDITRSLNAEGMFHKDLSICTQEVVTYAAWISPNTLQLTLFYVETPYVVTYTLAFHDQTIDFQFHTNVSMHLSDFQVTGMLMDATTPIYH